MIFLRKILCLKMCAVLQCEMQSNKTVFRVRVGAEEPSSGPTAGLCPVDPHGLSGSGGFSWCYRLLSHCHVGPEHGGKSHISLKHLHVYDSNAADNLQNEVLRGSYIIIIIIMMHWVYTALFQTLKRRLYNNCIIHSNQPNRTFLSVL